MFEKLLSKFKKDKKGGKASKAKKPAAKAASVADDEAGKQTGDAAERKADEALSPAAANGNGNGNGKPRVDVIDAMGNSVADMVTNIAEQLSASTEQLSKSRRYTNFAFTLLGVTLLSTGVYLTVMTLQLSSRLTQVDATLSMLTEQTGNQDSSIALIEEMRGEVTTLLAGQAQLSERTSSGSEIENSATAEQLRRLTQSLEAMLQNQAATDARLANLGEALKKLDGTGNQKVQKLLEDLEQKVADLYVIEQARIARELQRLRNDSVASE
jgi:hypothetical protein